MVHSAGHWGILGRQRRAPAMKASLTTFFLWGFAIILTLPAEAQRGGGHTGGFSGRGGASGASRGVSGARGMVCPPPPPARPPAPAVSPSPPSRPPPHPHPPPPA